MATTNNEQVQQEIQKLERAIAGLEAQRQVMGDEIVETSLVSLREKLANLTKLQEHPAQQRKLATILFLDVVDSTRLGQHLEPDEVLELMDGALKRLAAPVEAHGGHVTRFQGDGFKAVFGLPVAHENDPEQAVRAGLDILGVAAEIAAEMETERDISDFKVRVGVNTGLVASGGETEADDTVMGRAVNLAARLENAAPPGGLLISHFTYRHVRGIFNVEPREPLKAKGFDRLVEIYLVRSAKPRAFHVLTRGVEGVETRMVGRRTELDFLQDALLTALEEGEGQVVTISGEAGVGKSRLLYEFQNWFELLPQAIRLYQAQARQETQHIPFALLRDLFAFRFQIQDGDPIQVVREKFQLGVAQAFQDQPFMESSPQAAIPAWLSSEPGITSMQAADDVRAEESAHLLGHMLGFDFSHSPHLKGFLQDAEALHNRGLLALEAYFTALCRQGVVVIVLEDIHWADESSLDAIRRLARLTSDSPLLIVCLARGQLYEQRPYWGEGEHFHTRLDLRPLSKRESRQLVSEILQFVDQVPVELRELLVSGAEGNPFYLEELVKMLIEQGFIHTGEYDFQGVERWRVAADKLAQVELPTTLAGVLQARLDSLAVAEKRILQQAAVVGRTFWDQLLAHLYSHENGKQDDKELAEIFQVLRGKELIYRREQSVIRETVEYTFKHDLLREMVYETVLVKERKRYHGLVADWLLENSAERLGEYYGLIGEHLEKAGRVLEAAAYFTQAGDRALAHYFNAEAQEYYLRALRLEADPSLRAKILTQVGRALNRLGLFDQAMQHWSEGMEICQQQDDREGLARLYYLAMRAANPYHSARALQLVQPALALEPYLGESVLCAHLLHQIGRTYKFNQVPDQAADYCQRALIMAERLGDVEVQADALCTLGLLPGLSTHEAIQTLTKAEKLADSHQLYYILGRARNNLAYVTDEINARLVHQLRAAEAYRNRGDIEGELRSLMNAAFLKMHLGDLAGAQRMLAYIQERLFSLPRLDILNLRMILARGYYLALKGNWAEARELAWQSYKLAEQNYNLNQMFNPTLVMLWTLWEVDRFYQKQDWSEVETLLLKVLGKSVDGLNPAGYRAASVVHARPGSIRKSA
jgi:class 3 adenylate cyclase/tetratricopeptide (TPR) repeat protein